MVALSCRPSLAGYTLLSRKKCCFLRRFQYSTPVIQEHRSIAFSSIESKRRPDSHGVTISLDLHSGFVVMAEMISGKGGVLNG